MILIAPIAALVAILLINDVKSFHISSYSSSRIPSSSSLSSLPPPLASVTKSFRPPRLPVWPVLPGALLTLLDILRVPQRYSSYLESYVLGGRVAPAQFDDPMETSPFVMLVHHKHRFNGTPFDRLVLWATSKLLPAGFPAHPHRGFETLTLCMEGGMTHRDSFGVSQVYGAGAEGGWAQWLRAGRGILHEEFWDVSQGEDQEVRP